MDTITLFVGHDGHVYARSTEAQVAELFGTDTLPTPYTWQANRAEVLDNIKALNHSKRVRWAQGTVYHHGVECHQNALVNQ